jgi:hypothetical protein
MKVIAFAILFFCLTLNVHAAGQHIVSVSVDTKGASLNAFEGELVGDVSAIQEIRDSNSIVSVWLVRPHVEEGVLVFSGITPGGFRGSSGGLFSLVLSGDDSSFELHTGSGYVNDGLGTSVPLWIITRPQSEEQKTDTVAPEPFTVLLSEDTEAFDGHTFIVFEAHDKGVGVSHYHVCEGLWGGCTDAVSPYVLLDQDARSVIRVKAFDNFENVRTAYLFTAEAKMWYGLYVLLAILIVACARFFL